METRFRGWPEQAYAVLLQLGGDPSRETRERVRRDREAQVRQPMIHLLSDLAATDPWYEDFAVWRYASTAYWWQNQCAIVRIARNVEIGFRFSLDGLRIGASWRYASGERIALFRAAVAADGSGRALEDLVVSLAADGHEILGDVMSRVPAATPPVILVPPCSSTVPSSPPAKSNPKPSMTSSPFTTRASGYGHCSPGSPSTRPPRRKRRWPQRPPSRTPVEDR
jgi:hypothetical protein